MERLTSQVAEDRLRYERLSLSLTKFSSSILDELTTLEHTHHALSEDVSRLEAAEASSWKSVLLADEQLAWALRLIDEVHEDTLALAAYQVPLPDVSQTSS